MPLKMNDKQQVMEVGGITVEVIRKPVKNLNFSVRPPDGNVRVSVPRAMSDEAVRQVIVSHLPWIHKHRARIQALPMQPVLEMVNGEIHDFLGRPYRLQTIETARYWVEIKGETMLLYVPAGTGTKQRKTVLNEWYRIQLKAMLPDMIAHWEPIIGVQVAQWGVKRMKTRWGSCNSRAGRIWLSLDLAQKSEECIEYVLVHEMVHILERLHNARFWGYMDQFLPQWPLYRGQLKKATIRE